MAYGRLTLANNSLPDTAEKAFANMTCIGFYFLLRPSEYAGIDAKYSVFTLNDVHLYCGRRKLCLATASEWDIRTATSMRLHFTTQKNQRKGDVIAHSRSEHPFCCPVRAAIRMILTHREWFAATNTPYDGSVRLASYYHRGRRINIRPANITNQLRFAARQLFHETGIDPSSISARSLRAGGAMALLCGKVDSNTIQLLGRWHSDSMLLYLHQEALPVMKNLARKMFAGGSYNFLPTALVPLL
jgi:hypothetical protein